jgi:hypothetical protein
MGAAIRTAAATSANPNSQNLRFLTFRLPSSSGEAPCTRSCLVLRVPASDSAKIRSPT